MMPMMQIHTEKNQKEIKSHGNYEFPVNISPESIQSYEQGYFLWHWHPEIELTWIISGQIEYYVNDRKYLLSEDVYKRQFLMRIPSVSASPSSTILAVAASFTSKLMVVLLP